MVELIRTTPTYVVSASRDRSQAFPNVRFIPSIEPAVVGKLEDEHSDILILGSPTTVIRMLENGALRELNLAVIPTVVGSGPGLFDTVSRPLVFSTQQHVCWAAG